MDAFQHDLGQVAVKEGQHRFRFGIAEAAVEFHYLRTFVGNHEASVEAAFEGVSFFFHGCHDGTENFDFHFVHHFVGHHGSRCIGAHAAGVGAFVVVEDSLVVLGGNHGHHVGAIAETEDRCFFSFHEFFDNHGPSGAAEAVAFQHVFHCTHCLCFILGNDDAFACCQAVGFDDDGIFLVVFQVFHCFVFVSKDFIGCCGNAVFFHQVLGKSFGSFNASCRFGGAEEGKSLRFEFICQTFGENCFRSSYGEVHFHQFSKIQDVLMSFHRNEVSHVAHAVIPGNGIDFRDGRALCQPPQQGMFPAAAAND